MSGRAQIEALLALVNTAVRDALAEYDKTGMEVPTLDSTDASTLSAMSDNLPLKKAVRLLEGACSQLCATLAPPAHTVINQAQDYNWAALHVVVRARVADELDNHPNGLHVCELAKAVSIEQGKLARLLRLLGTRNCFREVDTDVFANNRLSLVLRSSFNLSDLIDIHTTEMAKSGTVLYDNLKNAQCGPSYEPTRSPFMYSIHGENADGSFFDWLKAHPERRMIFGRGMIGMADVMGSLSNLHNFPWTEATTICDVGSGIGAFAIPLAQTYPHVRLTLHDLPETIAQAKDIWAEKYPAAVQEQRVQFLPLNFFEDVPVQGQDIYYLRNIIHNWPDARAALILRNMQKAMAPHSRLLIHDYVLQHLHRKADSEPGVDVAPEPLLPNFGAGSARMYNQDITMLMCYNSKERTVRDCTELGREAGLRLEKVWDYGETSVLEFRLADS
ncbi:S-adenosyl-L-methionine-dependent methyltransferase [Amylocystis lapponica]|nr:S-adenosyl-L-methionine-dependent methyltransferase [Amylocystis lapponica]